VHAKTPRPPRRRTGGLTFPGALACGLTPRLPDAAEANVARLAGIPAAAKG
jgi:hypothetical protein